MEFSQLVLRHRLAPVTCLESRQDGKVQREERRRNFRVYLGWQYFFNVRPIQIAYGSFRIDGSVIGSLRVLQDSQQGARNLFKFKDFLFWYVGLTHIRTRKEFLIRSLFYRLRVTGSIASLPNEIAATMNFLSLSLSLRLDRGKKTWLFVEGGTCKREHFYTSPTKQFGRRPKIISIFSYKRV